MGVFEGITHSEEIEELINSAQTMYDSAAEQLEEHKNSASKSLEKLGKMKLEAWSGDMSTFLGRFGAFANVQMKCIDDQNLGFFEHDISPNQLIVNMRTASVTANEVLKAGALSIGTGALVGIASYGGVMMFAKASTGTAIAALSGAAKTNATLAWFGGGSIKSGGLGMLAGKVVLAGIVLAPIALVAGSIAAAKGKERLAEAKKIHAEAKHAVAQMETVITGLEGIEQISEGYIELLEGLSKQFRPFLREMEVIAKDYTPGDDGKIDFNQLSEIEQKTLHLSWLLAQLYYHSLSRPILTDDGKVDAKASSMLDYSQKEYRQLSLDVTNLASEKEKINNTLASAKKEFTAAASKLESQRKKFRGYFIQQGKNRIQQWNLAIVPFVDSISKFENIDVANVFASEAFNQKIEDVFDTIFALSSSTKKIIADGVKSVDEASLMDIAIGGMQLLKIEEESNPACASSISKKGETAAWLQEGFRVGKEIVVADTLPASAVDSAENMITGITGKENLATAEYIHAKVAEVVKLMDIAVDKLNKSQSIIEKQNVCLKRISRLLVLYRVDVNKIYQSYEAPNADTALDFDQLQEEERKVIRIACNLTKLYYCVANAKVFENDKDFFGGISVNDALREAKKELHLLKKTTFKMTGDDLRAANIMWAPEAHHIFILNCVFMVLFAILSIVQLASRNLYGLIGFAGIGIAMPMLFYYKNLSKSQLWFWRLVRLLTACTIVLSVEIIGMVA